jgi:tRNA(Glu) U13 pseudouridine synthase TruD
VVGDLVIEPEKSEIVEDGVNPDDLMIEQDDIDDIDLPEELDGTSLEGKKALQPKFKSIEEALIEVTPENIHRYTINDVLMPIVGYKTRMPKNEELRQLILGIMAEDKITEETFEKHTLLDSTSAWGSYRKIVGFASEIEYDIVEFQNLNEDLLTADYNTKADP